MSYEKNFPTVSNHPDFYKSREFDVIGEPLIYTEERSKLSTLKPEVIPTLDAHYTISIKLDGKFVRLIKRGNLIRMLTSGNLDFYHNELAIRMKDFIDGQYNVELVYGNGLLKSRNNTGYLTTAYTKYSKQDPTAGEWEGQDEINFVIHDYLKPCADYKGYQIGMSYEKRRSLLLNNNLHLLTDDLLSIGKVAHVNVKDYDIDKLNHYAKVILNYDIGVHEGLVLQNIHSPYKIPKNNYSYKLKNVLEAIGTVVDVELDKNQANGTLILEVGGSDGNSLCRVSSGIDDYIRGMAYDDLLLKKVEFEYESITDKGEYNQPRIKRFGV